MQGAGLLRGTHFLDSTMRAERASPHEAYSAGAKVTDAFEKSRTLICDSTWVLQMETSCVVSGGDNMTSKG